MSILPTNVISSAVVAIVSAGTITATSIATQPPEIPSMPAFELAAFDYSNWYSNSGIWFNSVTGATTTVPPGLWNVAGGAMDWIPNECVMMTNPACFQPGYFTINNADPIYDDPDFSNPFEILASPLLLLSMLKLNLLLSLSTIFGDDPLGGFLGSALSLPIDLLYSPIYSLYQIGDELARSLAGAADASPLSIADLVSSVDIGGDTDPGFTDLGAAFGDMLPEI